MMAQGDAGGSMLQSRSALRTLAKNWSNLPSPSSRQGRLFSPFRSRLILISIARLASSALTEWLSISWTSKPARSIDSAGTSRSDRRRGNSRGYGGALLKPRSGVKAPPASTSTMNARCASRRRRGRGLRPFAGRLHGMPQSLVDGACSRADRETPRYSHRGGDRSERRISSCCGAANATGAAGF